MKSTPKTFSHQVLYSLIYLSIYHFLYIIGYVSILYIYIYIDRYIWWVMYHSWRHFCGVGRYVSYWYIYIYIYIYIFIYFVGHVSFLKTFLWGGEVCEYLTDIYIYIWWVIYLSWRHFCGLGRYVSILLIYIYIYIYMCVCVVFFREIHISCRHAFLG